MTVRNQLPFAQVPEWVIYSDELSAQAVRVYAVLHRYADKEGAAHPSRARIAERARCSRPTVDRCLAELTGAGALEITARFAAEDDDGKARQTSNDYLVRQTPKEPPVITGDEGVMPEPVITGDEGPVITGDDPMNESQIKREPTPEREKPIALARRARGEVWDALVDLYGEAPKEPKRRKAWGEVASSLLADGATGTRLRAWVGAFRGGEKDWAVCTIWALAKHYQRLGPNPGAKYGRESAMDGARQVLAEGGDPEMLAAVLNGRRVGNGSNGSARPVDEAPKGLPKRQA